jgi:uncharacterized protein with HEPN domain
MSKRSPQCNRIIHDYMGIGYKIVWLIKESFLPQLMLDIRTMVENLWFYPAISDSLQSF